MYNEIKRLSSPKEDIFMKDGKKYILVADDEQDIRQVLGLLMSGEGYEVALAADGKEALALASDEVDLYILDINMPGMSGISLAAELRKSYDAPIVFLTAYSGEAEKIMGFSVGADDYIVKPFSNLELLMRVKAILRRAGAGAIKNEENKLHFADAYLDTDRQTVIKGDEVIALTYTEYKILELLITNRKKIFSLDNIYESIWGFDAVGDSAIMVHIKNIRKKLSDDSRNPTYIKTAWGRGYYVD